MNERDCPFYVLTPVGEDYARACAALGLEPKPGVGLRIEDTDWLVWCFDDPTSAERFCARAQGRRASREELKALRKPTVKRR